MVDVPEEVVVMEVQSAPKEGRAAEEATNLDKLDPHVIDCEPHTASIEELESFVVDS